jgi:predicted RNA-binding protein YlxR (DUF448 family)/ribosomal protein L7Ae-like RNA K-turn-binding protein
MPAAAHSHRTSVATRVRAERETLLAWFPGEDGSPWPDWTGRAGRHLGRGAWTEPTAAAIRAAVKRNAFAAAFRADAPRVGADELLRRALEAGRKVFLERIGLANRAGALAAGQAASLERLGSGRVALLLLAADAGDACRRKFTHTARARGIVTVVVREGAVLGRSLGREFVSVAALDESPFSRDLARWARWLMDLGDTTLVGASLEDAVPEAAGERLSVPGVPERE